jgi:hypothetical protein
MKDWTGNSNSVFKSMGASNHTLEDRELHDYYATDPKAGELLLGIEKFVSPIWECACGEGHLSRVFEKAGYIVRSSDLIDRGYGEGGVNFLGMDVLEWDGDIITNPPYVYAQEFVEKALTIIPDGRKVAMFMKLSFLEGKARKQLFTKHPPKTIWVSSSRLLCVKNGVFGKGLGFITSSAIAYAWFIWIKGFKGTTELKWFN